MKYGGPLVLYARSANGISTEDKLTAAVGDRAGVRKWLEGQDAYTLHRQVRKKFPINPYTVSNLMEVWECDLIVVPNISRYKDSYSYLLSAINVFSKYLHLVPQKVKDGESRCRSVWFDLQRSSVFEAPPSYSTNRQGEGVSKQTVSRYFATRGNRTPDL
jgi:hypothetical protein